MKKTGRARITAKSTNQQMVEMTNDELRGALKNSITINSNHPNKKKYSEIFHEYMAPIINEIIDDERGLKTMLDWGQFIWNKGVAEHFPDYSKSKNVEELFPVFFATSLDKPLVMEYLDRKRKLFKDDNFFIVKQTSLLNPDGRLAISVAVDLVGNSISNEK